MSARDLSASQSTLPSDDSEAYDANHSNSPSEEESPPPPSTRPLILYQPPTVWSILRGAAINVLLPFINGLMLGFGELFAHEAAFRLGWSGTKVSCEGCGMVTALSHRLAAQMLAYGIILTCLLSRYSLAVVTRIQSAPASR